MDTNDLMTCFIDAADYAALATPKRKYRNEPTEVDGIRFDSRAEARRYRELKIMIATGTITDLDLQPRWRLVVNGVPICTYVADFRYWDVANGWYVVEDVKGGDATKTAAYKIKRKLMQACYGIEIQEVDA